MLGVRDKITRKVFRADGNGERLRYELDFGTVARGARAAGSRRGLEIRDRCEENIRDNKPIITKFNTSNAKFKHYRRVTMRIIPVIRNSMSPLRSS
jgi:hypothetical protein